MSSENFPIRTYHSNTPREETERGLFFILDFNWNRYRRKTICPFRAKLHFKWKWMIRLFCRTPSKLFNWWYSVLRVERSKWLWMIALKLPTASQWDFPRPRWWLENATHLSRRALPVTYAFVPTYEALTSDFYSPPPLVNIIGRIRFGRFFFVGAWCQIDVCADWRLCFLNMQGYAIRWTLANDARNLHTV